MKRWQPLWQANQFGTRVNITQVAGLSPVGDAKSEACMNATSVSLQWLAARLGFRL